MKEVTELEHFSKKNGISNLCFIAYKIENNNLDCCGLPCSECRFFNNPDEVLKTLLRKHVEKPKLTEDEKVILRNVDKKFRWIVRDEDGTVCVCEDIPLKTNGRHAWRSISFAYFEMFNHLFKFIKYEDNYPYLIENLLKED